MFERVLGERAVTFRGVKMAGRLRTCYAIRDAGGQITELLESGPSIEPDIITQLERAFLDRLRGRGRRRCCRAACRQGRRHRSTPGLIARLHNRVPHVIVDTSGPALEEALASGPAVVKPNRDEAARLIGRELSTMDDAMHAVREIARRGSRAAIVSLGAEGAAVCWDGRLARIDVPAQAAIDARRRGRLRRLLRRRPRGRARAIGSGRRCAAARGGVRRGERAHARDRAGAGATMWSG